MDTKNDNRFESTNEPRGNESKPSAPTSSTADNASVYKQPPIQEATHAGKSGKMEEDSKEDRKHTP